ncbi:DUF6151 family protein [Marinomonas sp. 15G1-11]|uniref:DUF6151 family protein n=1 Tax=Marinomonas phaeophyticola TaxID=3004091 RepID=A0ABT4JUF4_9GAMM|nr:DUF6151 family protein [Marinomonas sp. 15G1-11]MCZ2721413.1 DUF6151 family protein [Marinomonas sp. 15G1-11]
MTELALECRCGKVKGRVHSVNLKQGNHLVCYCQSCQNFANYLQSDVLNEFGGSDIFQIAPAFISIDLGVDQLKSLKLTDKGVCRWYTDCCKTPIGNTAGAKIPMVGILRSFIAKDQDINAKIGPIMGNVYVKNLDSPLPQSMSAPLSEKRLIFRMIRKILLWKILAKGTPNPFMNSQGKPIVKPHKI